MPRPLSAPEAEVLAELARRFEALMGEERARMEREGIPTVVARAIEAENRALFDEQARDLAVWAASTVAVH